MEANEMTMTMTTMATAGSTPATASGPPRGGAALRRAMMMATLAALLALGGVFGLQPRVAEATPRTLGRGTAAPATMPGAAAVEPDTPEAREARDAPEAADADAGPAVEPDDDVPGSSPGRTGKQVSGKLNLNTATAAQLMMLPGIGPAKAERVLAWRKRNGSFKRIVDLRRVKGFGYRTVKKLEANLAVKGETTLRASP